MKSKDKREKEFDAIRMTREIKERISREIEGMDVDQLKAYFAERRAKLFSGF